MQHLPDPDFQGQARVMPVLHFLLSLPWLLAHFVDGGHHHRAQRRHSGVVQPAPVHRHAEKTGRAQGFDFGVEFLQMAAEVV